jgi:hypothetical protein
LAQHWDLVARYEDLDVLGCAGTGEQHELADRAFEHERGESESTGMLIGELPWPRILDDEGPGQRRDTVLATHKLLRKHGRHAV